MGRGNASLCRQKLSSGAVQLDRSGAVSSATRSDSGVPEIGLGEIVVGDDDRGFEVEDEGQVLFRLEERVSLGRGWRGRGLAVAVQAGGFRQQGIDVFVGSGAVRPELVDPGREGAVRIVDEMQQFGVDRQFEAQPVVERVAQGPGGFAEILRPTMRPLPLRVEAAPDGGEHVNPSWGRSLSFGECSGDVGADFDGLFDKDRQQFCIDLLFAGVEQAAGFGRQLGGFGRSGGWASGR